MAETLRHQLTGLSTHQSGRLASLFGLGGLLWFSPSVLEFIEIAFAFRLNESMFKPFGGVILFISFLYLFSIGMARTIGQ